MQRARKLKWRHRKFIEKLVEQNKVGRISEFKEITDSKRSLIYRVIWSLVVTTCLLIYCYQMYDRISYFFKSPTSVNVYERKIDNEIVPPISYCHPINKYVWDCYKKGTRAVTPLESFLPLQSLVQTPGVDLTQLWNINQTMDIIIDITNVNQRMTKRNSFTINKRLSSTPWGVCLQMQANKSLSGVQIYDTIKTTFKVIELMVNKSFSTISMDKPFQFSMGMYLTAATKLDLGLTWREYHLINTDKKPCVPTQQYIQCGKRCVNLKLSKNPCQMPYTNVPAKSPIICNNSLQTLAIFKQNLKDVIFPTPYIDCNCPRDCNDIIYDASMLVQIIKGSEFTFKLDADHVTVLEETFLYKLIDLMTDFGGNLGLWLGFSLLSLLDTFGIIVSNSTRRKKDPIQIKIEQCFNRQVKIIENKEMKKEMNLPSLICAIILIVSSIIITAGKISIYTENPIHTVISIEEEPVITFPNIIICEWPLLKDLNKLKYKCMKKQKLSTCEIDFLDIIDLNETTVDHLWNWTYSKKTDSIGSALLNQYSPFSMDVVNAAKKHKIISTEGYCKKYSFGAVKMSGFIPFLNFFMESRYKNCIPQYAYAYLTAANDPMFPYLSRVKIIPGMITEVLMRKTKAVYLNTKKRPCLLNATNYYECKSRCFQEKVETQQVCSLPFAFKQNIPVCATSEIAKSLRNTFYKIYFHTDVEKNCSCKRLCQQVNYKLSSFAFPSFLSFGTVSAFLFTTYKIEVITEEYHYHFESLICDIGNAMSLFLGVSTLTIAHFLLNYIFKFLKRA